MSLLERLRYRCLDRGESFQTFMETYCFDSEVKETLSSDDPKERLVGASLLTMRSAVNGLLAALKVEGDEYAVCSSCDRFVRVTPTCGWCGAAMPQATRAGHEDEKKAKELGQ